MGACPSFVPGSDAGAASGAITGKGYSDDLLGAAADRTMAAVPISRRRCHGLFRHSDTEQRGRRGLHRLAERGGWGDEVGLPKDGGSDVCADLPGGDRDTGKPVIEPGRILIAEWLGDDRDTGQIVAEQHRSRSTAARAEPYGR